MNVQPWDFPKHWPTREKTLKAPVCQEEWECMKPGLYKLRYEGHDLAISKERGSDCWRKLYTIWIDGVAVAKEWSAGQAKSKATKLVNRAHKEEKPIVPSDEITDDITVAEYLPDTAEPMLSSQRDTVQRAVDDLRLIQSRVEAINSQKEDDGTLRFTITGKIDISSLATLTKTVELLRESGQVTCDVTLPSRISL